MGKALTHYAGGRYRLSLGLSVALVTTLISMATVAFGDWGNLGAQVLTGAGRFAFSFFIWLLFVPVTQLVKNKLAAFFAFGVLCVLAALPLVPYQMWVNWITDSYYAPFEDPNGITDWQEHYQWIYTWRAVLLGLLTFIIQYREDLLAEKQFYLVANEKLKNENLSQQLETLKQEVDPHFLFNTLNAMTTLIRSDPERAEKYVVEVASVYRYLLRHNRSEAVLLREELAFLRAYLSLLDLRFEGGLRLDLKIDEQLKDKKVFPLSLQLLVENAVKHNVVTREMPLEVHIFTKEDDLIVVENRIQLRATTEGVSRYGLAHLGKRYELHGGTAIQITDAGGVFRVCLPLI